MLVIVLGVAIAVAVGCSSGDSERRSAVSTTVAPYPLDRSLRLDQVQVLASHNSYHARPYPEVLAGLQKVLPAVAPTLDYAHGPLPEQFDLGVRAIELDVYDDPDGGKFAHPSYPESVGVELPDRPEMDEPGYKVVHQAAVDTNSTCLTLVACFELVDAWSHAHPRHVPIGVQIEMKDGTITEPMFRRLEGEITSVFARDRYFTPDDVRGESPTLGEAVKARGWPSLGAVRGKVYFLLDNGDDVRETYLTGHPSLEGRLIFTPSSPGQADAAFAKLNDPIGDAADIDKALAQNMLIRTRADADTQQARANDHRSADAALSGGAQIVSTDYEQPDPKRKTGYTVRIPGGTPARCNPVTAPSGCQPTDVEDPAKLAR
jgi:Phosphoinositide phospholipase C, Ca2+-dependent